MFPPSFINQMASKGAIALALSALSGASIAADQVPPPGGMPALLELVRGEQRPAFSDQQDHAVFVRLKRQGVLPLISRLHNKLTAHCEAIGGTVEPPLPGSAQKYGRDYLVSVLKVPSELVDRYGTDAGYVASMTVEGGVKFPGFRPLTPDILAGFQDWGYRVTEVFPELPIVKDAEGKQGICFERKDVDRRALFSWHMLFAWKTQDQFLGDLIVGLRDEVSLEARERDLIGGYYEGRRQREQAENAKANRVSEFAREQERQRQQADEDRRQASLAAAAAARREASLQEDQRRQLARDATEFRKSVASGDESHCGLVIEVKPKVVQVQTMAGAMWLRRDELYPAGRAACVIRNGQYVPPVAP